MKRLVWRGFTAVWAVQPGHVLCPLDLGARLKGAFFDHLGARLVAVVVYGLSLDQAHQEGITTLATSP